MEANKIIRQSLDTELYPENDGDDKSDRRAERSDDKSQMSFISCEYDNYSDNESIDRTSDVSRLYLEYESSGNEYDTKDFKGDSSIKEEKQFDPKTVYMVVVHKKANGDGLFRCELCNVMFSTTNERNKHLSTHKPGICKKCEICNNIVDTNAYEIHMKLHREAYKHRRAKNKVQCKTCGKIVGKTYLKFHMKMHGTEADKIERKKQCPFCDKLVSFYYFRSHVKRMHGDSDVDTDAASKEVIRCPICERLYKKTYLQTHIASHGNHQKQYVCDQCGRLFKHHSAFQTHLLTHGGELKYKCQFCPYQGLHLGLLKVHVRTHTKDYLYECSTCNKKFITKSNLSVHERRHKEPNLFVCPECNRGFSTKRSFDKHYKLIHLGIRNEKCEICGKAYGHRDGLLSHQNKVHNREKSTRKGRLPSYLKVKLTTPTIDDENKVVIKSESSNI